MLTEGGVHFRVWAPRRKAVAVVLEGGTAGDAPAVIPLTAESGGYFAGVVAEAAEGSLYRFRLDEEEMLHPDPASRFQPDGPTGPSRVIDPFLFEWTDHEWRGVTIRGQVIYEMHIGTFTREGTWAAAARRLEELADLGIGLIELMPVADFGGRFGWGYDGVDLFAPTRLYGTPDEFRRFVDIAHAAGLGVILDVVYNHFGPVGNFTREYSLDYFTDHYETDWGEALNFDGRNSGPVREFIVANAGYWVEEFHLDGLRLDATQEIIDRSPEHIVAALARHARQKATPRTIVIIGENEPQDERLVLPASEGGCGLDALWNDDFHHSAMVALTGRNEAYYTDYLGSPQELVSAAKGHFLYQGQYYSWQRKRRGSATYGLSALAFVNYLQNHDQVANSARGQRIHELTTAGRLRAMTAFLLLIPGTPMLFQGQEFGACCPFRYFADHEADLARVVREGRANFLQQFRSIKSPDIQERQADPADPATFAQCKLDHRERQNHAEVYALHRDLLRLRREDAVFREQRTDWLHGAVLAPEAFVLRFLGGDDGDRLLVVNLGRDLIFSPASEPLLAPPADSHWEIIWSSESAQYGGNGTPSPNTEGKWHIPGHAALVLGPKKIARLYNGR